MKENKKLPESLDEWLASATPEEKTKFVEAFNSGTLFPTTVEVKAEEERQERELAAMEPAAREAFLKRLDEACEKGRRLLPFTLQAMEGDGRTWRCLKLECGGVMRLAEAKSIATEQEVWRCVLCGKVALEDRLVKEFAKVLAGRATGENEQKATEGTK